MHKYLTSFDRTVGAWIKLLPDWVNPLMHFVTHVGEPVYVLGAAVILAATAFFKGSYQVVAAVVFGFMAFACNTAVKFAVHRERPETMFAQSMKIKSYSFPSGHAFGTMFFFGLFAYLAFVHLPKPWNVIIAAVLGVLILLVGVSRVYLGAHFPSDVLVGWIFGAICLALVIRYVL